MNLYIFLGADPCKTNNPCKFPGVCDSFGNGTVFCICPKYYTGQFCEQGLCLLIHITSKKKKKDLKKEFLFKATFIE